jgi:hypothetical protein
VGWQLLLTLVGAALELSGIGLVVLDVREARSQAGSVLHKDATVAVFAGIARWPADPAPMTAEPLTVEQRLDRLEQALTALRAETVRQIDVVENLLREELWGLIKEARQHVEERDNALRALLSDQLDAGIGRRWLGGFLFAAGVTAQTVANIIGIG